MQLVKVSSQFIHFNGRLSSTISISLFRLHSFGRERGKIKFPQNFPHDKESKSAILSSFLLLVLDFIDNISNLWQLQIFVHSLLDFYKSIKPLEPT